MLLMIRVLFLISIHFKLSKLEVKLSWILLIEMIINLSAEATYLHRPDMLEKRELSDEEKKMLADIKAEAKSTTLD